MTQRHVLAVAGLLGSLVWTSSVQAKDVYYVSGYWGTPTDSATMVVKDGEGNTVTLPIADTDTIVVREGTADGPVYGAAADSAYVSDETKYIPKNIRIERDFTFNAGVKTALFAGSTIEIASDKVLVIQSTRWNTAYVGTVTFDGAGTADLSGASQVASPIKVSSSVNLQLPGDYVGEIAVTDPENLDMSKKYPGYVKWLGEDGVAHLIKEVDIVAYVGDRPFVTLADAFDAAKPAGTIVMSAWPTANLPQGVKDAAQWQGTVTFSGTMPGGFTPANYGNASSTIEFKGVSGGYLVNLGSFAGTLKVTDGDETTPGWQVGDGYGSDNFVFGALVGDGTIVDVNSGVKQQYSFKDASNFAGSIKNAEAANGKRFIIGESVHGSASAQTGRIVVEAGYTARVAEGQVLSGRWGMLVYGTVKGSGTLACTGSKMVYFGCGPSGGPTGDEATIDLSEGAPTVDSSCGVTFGSTLTLKNVRPGDTVLKCASQPANMSTVTLKDVTGATPSFWSLAYENGAVKLAGDTKVMKGEETWTLTAGEYAAFPNPLLLDLTDYDIGDRTSSIGETPHRLITLPVGTTTEQTQAIIEKIQLVSPKWHRAHLVADGNEIKLTADTMTIFWNAWRGTFWEHYGQNDANGNHGLGRALDGTVQAILSGDTVVFDKKHYTDENGDFAEQTPYWHYDENLYIKDEVVPGTSNEWDLKVLQGVTLKMGLRGSRAAGQNVITALKIYVDAGSTLELGYWGNTHHYQGVIRDDVVFGGAGTIALGADMGPSCRVEGNIGVSGTDVPTMNLNDKELVLTGTNSTIGVNLTGFGAITPTAAGIHLTGDVDFGDAATIDASNAANMLTLDGVVDFGSNLTVKLSATQVSSMPVQVLALGSSATLNMTATDVRVLVDGKPVAAFYELYREGNGLYVRVKDLAITYGASAAEGYDFAGSLVTVTMDPAVLDLPITVTVNGRDWIGTVGANGSGVVMVGDEDTFLESGAYDYTVRVGEETLTGSLFVGDRWFAADPVTGTSVVMGGSWMTAAPTIKEGKYQLTGEATFELADDKAVGEVGVIEQSLAFTSAADAETLKDAEDSGVLEGVRGAVTLAEEEDGTLCWKGYVNGAWLTLTSDGATLGTHTIRVEYDRRETLAKMRYLVDGAEVSEWLAVEGGDSAPALESISYVGNGALSQLTGFVDNPALVEYAGVKYKSMEAAVAAWKAAGKSGVITLLTNIFFAPEPGTYRIQKNGYSLYLTNDMIITSEDGTTVVVGFPPTVDRYTTGLVFDGETMDAPFIIDGEWLGHAIPWKRHSLVQAALTEKPKNADFTRWQAYALGFATNEVETAKACVWAVQNAESDKVTLDDGLEIRPARETGVVVTRRLVGSVSAPAREDTGGTMTAVETAYDEETGLPVFDLTKMADKVQYLKISYEFSGDAGQE